MSENSVEYKKRRGYKQKMKLNTKQTIKIGFAFLSICAFWQMYNSVIPLILTNTFHMNETFSGAIPSVSVQGHYNEILSLQKYSGMREVMEEEETEVSNIGNAICPNNPVAVKFICRLIDITVDIFKPDILMIGGDEIYSSG